MMALAQMSVGPDMILLTRTALGSGRAVGLAMACGIACGLAVHATLALSGVSQLLLLNDSAVAAITILGAAYLIYLGMLMLRSAWKGGRPEAPKPVVDAISLATAWRRGLLCNLLNPKAAFAISAMTLPFLKVGSGTAWSAALFSVIVLQAWVLWSLWVVLLQMPKVSALYLRAGRVLDAIFGWALVALAVWLLGSADFQPFLRG